MNNLSNQELQAIKDNAWRAGFECGLTIKVDRSVEDVEALLNLLKSAADADDYELDYTDDEEIDVKLDIGDLVELEEGRYYIVCKLDGDNIVAVDPLNRRLVSGKKSDVLSVGKLDMCNDD